MKLEKNEFDYFLIGGKKIAGVSFFAIDVTLFKSTHIAGVLKFQLLKYVVSHSSTDPRSIVSWFPALSFLFNYSSLKSCIEKDAKE